MGDVHRPLRLKLDGDALVHNWRTLAKASGSATTGAAVKADGYGLGAAEVASKLSGAGCREFFVATWAEALDLSRTIAPSLISVLNGLGESDVALALSLGAVPVINSPVQAVRWKEAGGGRCHVMLDSGINRLGIGPDQLSQELLDGLDIDILLSHLASADTDTAQNERQLQLFRQMADGVNARRRSFANSAGIQLGPDYHFNLTRPGISIYGGIERPELENDIRQVARIEAQLLQVRALVAGQTVGYGATFTCPRDMTVGTIAIGYADGYLRGFSNSGQCRFEGHIVPVIGRVSMDLVTLDLGDLALLEGDWVEVDYHLPTASRLSGLSQYELLTGLGARFERIWN